MTTRRRNHASAFCPDAAASLAAFRNALSFGHSGLRARAARSLLQIAWRGDAEIWPHLISYVLPAALVDTALLLAGVAILTAIAGTGTAWLVTAYQFPGRDTLAWLLPLPLAIPTYIVAYVYVDLLDAIGPVQSALARADRLALGRRLLVSECALAARRDLRHRHRALSLRLSRRARDVPDPERLA